MTSRFRLLGTIAAILVIAVTANADFTIVRASASTLPVPAPVVHDAGRNGRVSPTLLSPLRSVPTQLVNDSIGGVDSDDWYLVSVTGFNGLMRASAVTIVLSTSTPGVTVELVPESSATPLVVQGSEAPGPKVISASLMPGNFLVHVSSTAAPASYSLNLSIATTR